LSIEATFSIADFRLLIADCGIRQSDQSNLKSVIRNAVPLVFGGYGVGAFFFSGTD